MGIRESKSEGRLQTCSRPSARARCGGITGSWATGWSDLEVRHRAGYYYGTTATYLISVAIHSLLKGCWCCSAWLLPW